jgi:hypothetical protein
MKFQIVFENSGDSIEFESVYPQVLEYYVDQLNQRNINLFSVLKKSQPWPNVVAQRINQLHSTLSEVNSWIHELTDWQYDVFNTEDYLDQYNLNKLHSDWVNSLNQLYDIEAKRKQSNFSGTAELIHDMFPDSERFVKIGNLLSKLNRTQLYDDINLNAHMVEEMFDTISFETVAGGLLHPFPNMFDKSILTNDIANFSLTFNHCGRTLYNKFLYFDRNLEHNDENSFNEFLGFVSLSLSPSQTIPLSKEYQAWCQSHGRVPIGKNLNLGNIPNLCDRLTYYRLLIFKNLKSNNNFSIHIT